MEKMTKQIKQLNYMKNKDVNFQTRFIKDNLQNIVQLTEENDADQKQIKPGFKNHILKKQPLRNKARIGCLQKIAIYLRGIKRYFTEKLPEYTIDSTNNNFEEKIIKINNKRQLKKPLLPAQKIAKKVLILDLDETLLYTSFIQPIKYDFQCKISFNNKIITIYVNKRFGLDSFLYQMSLIYQIIIFTSSVKKYADTLIDQIDPKGRISHRLYRQHCLSINNTYFIKDIHSLGRKLKDIIIVDDNSTTKILQPQRFYHITPFEGNAKDRALCKLSAFLKHLHYQSQISNISEERKKFEQIQIELVEQGIKKKKSNNSRIQQNICEAESQATLSTQNNSEILTNITLYQ